MPVTSFRPPARPPARPLTVRRVLNSIEAKEKEKGDSDKVNIIAAYRDKVEKELEKICQELLEVLEK